ncbi:MAG: CBS domain-containing protein [Myxococcota bacterium]|nr:CBS domain-containing protein [Myxococcota bacterium]
MRKTTPVREVMSRLPAEVDRRDPVADVVRLMQEHHCHHVPIMDGAHPFGILSSQDLYELVLRDGATAKEMSAGEVCTTDPLTVDPMRPAVEVAQAMLERGVSSALVADGDILVGIFTTTDALRLVARL